MEKRFLAILLCIVLLCQSAFGFDLAGDGSVREDAWDYSGTSGAAAVDSEDELLGLVSSEELGERAAELESGFSAEDDMDGLVGATEKNDLPMEEDSFEAEPGEGETKTVPGKQGKLIGEYEKRDGIIYGHLINPMYADIITEADLPPLPEYGSADDFVGATVDKSFSDRESVLSYLRAQLVQRKSYASYEYTVSYGEWDTIDNLINEIVYNPFDEAVSEHTGVPTEGDYIYYHFGGCNYTCSFLYLDESTLIITAAFSILYYTTAEQENLVTLSVNEWLHSWDPTGMSDYAKIKKVYDFVTDNTHYDYEHLDFNHYQLQYTAYAALIEKTAVCQGYGVLVYRLLLELGIDCRCIMGENHLWNIVKLGNLYYYLDATWEEDNAKQGLTYDWFLRGNDPELFPDHTPEESIFDGAFWEKYPMSRRDYDTGVPAGQSSPITSSGKCGDGLIWSLHENGTLEISGKGDMDDYFVEIKENESVTSAPWGTQIDTVLIGNGVTSIGVAAFCGCKDLHKLTLPDGLLSIKSYAFYNCELLMTASDVMLPATVESIGEWAFTNCKGLTYVIFPSSLTFLGANAFRGCDSLRNIVFSEGLHSIGDYTFQGCVHLGDVELPNSLTSIGAYAFEGCENFGSIRIPDGVSQMGDAAFMNCKYLRNILIPESVSQIGQSAFDGCANLTIYCEDNSYAQSYARTNQIPFKSIHEYPSWEFDNIKYGSCGDQLSWSLDTEGTLTISGLGQMDSYVIEDRDQGFLEGEGLPWGTEIREVIIYEGVTTIGHNAFYQCKNLKSVHLPQTLTSVGAYAFEDCIRLTEITIPDSVNTIYKYAFKGCTSLRDITLPARGTRFEEGIFLDCTGLTSVRIPEGIGCIGESAFENCTNLTNITFPESLESIDAFAFKNCSSLTDVRIPERVVLLGQESFSHCTGLKTVTLPKTLTEMDDEAFSSCTALESIQGLNDIIYFGNYVFSDCKKLRTFSSDLKELKLLGEGTFENCQSLTGFFYLNKVTNIPASAFYHCKKLSGVEIAKEVTAIGKKAFDGCSSLTIHGYTNSAADVYAKKQGIPFKSIGTVTPKITLNKSKVTLYADSDDEYKSFNAVKLVATLQNTSGKIVFKSSKPKVAKVSNNGILEPLAKGKTTITAYLQGNSKVKASCVVTVKNSSFTVKTSTVKVKKGKTYKLTYTLKKPKTGEVYFDDEDCDKIARTKLKDGYCSITGLKKGSGKLKLYYGNQIKTIKITVN